MRHKNNIILSRPDTTYEQFVVMIGNEHAWLIRLCARLTGNSEIAEDLAQETSLEAWRNLHKFDTQEATFHPDNWRKWLTVIAHNVCKRWARNYYETSRHIFISYDDGVTDDLENLLSNDNDIEVELEREELALLLDHALALLSPSVREVLIERYIHESSHTEIAERLGLREDALVQRLHRGKMALRRVITTQMRDEALTFGIAVPEVDTTCQETRIWCPFCGKGQLIRYNDQQARSMSYTCPRCWQITSTSVPEAWNGLRSHKSILSRQLAWLRNHYWQAINNRKGACLKCGHQAHVIVHQYAGISPHQNNFQNRVVYLHCTFCGYEEWNGLPHLSLDTSEAQQFWRKHPHMLWLPAYEIESSGQPAFISSFRSLTNKAQLDIICHATTLEVLSVHETFHS